MTLLNILVLISIFAVSLGSNEWDSFKDQHGKHYTSDHEEEVRKQIFVTNQGLIDEHNRRYDLGLESFSMAMNQFGDLNEEEYRARLLCLSLAADQGTGNTEEAADILRLRAPEAVDWREKGAVTPVKDQGQCGACWAFSTTGSLESQLFLKTGKLVSLSEQNLVDCSQSFGNSGCFGGLMENAFQYIQYNGGIDSEQAYPYEAKDNACRFKNESVVTSVSGFVKIPSGDEKTLQSAVAGSGPVSVAIDASGKFQFYGKGVYYNSQCSALNHAVLAVGYGSESGKDYWLVKNSWGTAWGDKGYIRMSRNLENNCGIATLASYPTLS